MNKEPLLDIFNCSDKELIRWFQKNPNKWISDIVNPEMTRRLKVSTDSLNDSIKEMNTSTKRYSNIMIWLTVVLLMLTIIISVDPIIKLVIFIKGFF